MEIVGLVLTALGALGALALVPSVRDYPERRRHVRTVRGRLVPTWHVTEATDHMTAKVLTGVYLEILNSGRWPVREVIVLNPACVATESRRELAAGESWTLDVPLHRARDEFGQPVALQLVDVREHMWRWTPALDELLPIPAPLPLHARFVQWTARHLWPRSAHAAFARAPKPMQRALWGYDPEG